MAVTVLEPACDQLVDPHACRFIDRPLRDQDLAQALRRVTAPDFKGSDELLLIDQPALECEQTEEQVAERMHASVHGEPPDLLDVEQSADRVAPTQ